MSDNLDGTKWCVYCNGVADFQWLDGGFYVCSECIKEGECDSNPLCQFCNEREVTHNVTGNLMCCKCHGQCESTDGGECEGAI